MRNLGTALLLVALLIWAAPETTRGQTGEYGPESAPPTLEGGDAEIHTELRALLRGIQEAVNSERYGDLAPFFHDRMRVTTINQEVLASPADIPPYFERWFGEGGFLSKVDMELTPDALTELYVSDQMGIVRGSGDESYILSDGRSFDMKTRWTAATIRDDDGRWKILTLHIGTDFLDNPILDVAEASLGYAAGGGAAVGLIVGILATLLFRRRRAA
jgi:ketosteroid isomerase-like protein